MDEEEEEPKGVYSEMPYSADTDNEDSSSGIKRLSNSTSVKCTFIDGAANSANSRLLQANSNGHLSSDLKSVSPMQFFNIQDGGCFLEDSSPPNLFRKICESALMHESSKDVTLVSDAKQTLGLDEIGEQQQQHHIHHRRLLQKNTENFVEEESPEMNDDLFVPITEELPSDATSLSCDESSSNQNNLKQSSTLVKLELMTDHRKSNGCHSNGVDDKTEKDGCQECLEEDEEDKSVGGGDQQHAIVVHLPEDYVSLIPIMPMESLLLGNFTLLPSSTNSPIKFQVIEDDGSVKRISVNPVCQSDDPLTVCTLTEQNEDDSDGATSSAYPSPPPPSVPMGGGGSNEFVSSTTGGTALEKPFRCELCSATFNRLGNYTRHKKIHTVPTKEDQRFHCDVCGKHFIQRCDLTRHRHIHSGTEPHRCGTCGKGYIRHSDLVIHQRFHNKEKPFACSHCTKGFSQRGDLNRHLRSIHLQVKPLTCGHCHKKFAKEATLIRHMQIQHRDIILNSLAKCGTDGLPAVKQENCIADTTTFTSIDPS